MLGLGESLHEVFEVLADLRAVGCRAVTLGQYLSPSPAHLPVVEYLPPRVFAALERQAAAMGFDPGRLGTAGAEFVPRRRHPLRLSSSGSR